LKVNFHLRPNLLPGLATKIVIYSTREMSPKKFTPPVCQGCVEGAIEEGEVFSGALNQ
jgi:hypothetical protein